MEIRSAKQTWPSRGKIYPSMTDGINPRIQSLAIVVQHADRPKNESVRAKHSDNLDTAFARPDFAAPTFRRAEAGQNAGGRRVDDESRETVRAAG